jgi:hypothetical protein
MWQPFLLEILLANQCDPVSADNFFYLFFNKKYNFLNVKKISGGKGDL